MIIGVKNPQINNTRVKQTRSKSNSKNDIAQAPHHVPTTRPNRIFQRIAYDEHPTTSYGNPIGQLKQENSLRILFQNINGGQLVKCALKQSITDHCIENIRNQDSG